MMNKKLAPITRPYNDYIVLAQDEQDFRTKANKIANGDTNGFYKIEDALKKVTTSKTEK